MKAAPRQFALEFPHRPAYGREDFLVTAANSEAVAFIDRWPGWNMPALWLYGPASSGKSHLAAVWAQKAAAPIISAEDLLKDTADNLSKRGAHLVVERADLIVGDREPETVLFHLYNLLKEEGRSLLLTACASPQHLQFVVPDLASRVRSCPSIAIQAPDDDLLGALMVKHFHDRQLSVPEEGIAYLLPRIERSFDALQQLVSMVDKRALQEKKPVTIPLLREVLIEISTQG
ncbi:MAG: DNA replication protein [Alphaproteobacteria bacterium]|nr:DNA replication protein [Alphaproteobacteria bacterium]